ncbi:hypothetical protein FHX64_000181 [Microbacter margulisiae]|uniref:Uncharacterized protein n=1 Tax=Microbacter margulisiae TaxID=1350067 RepID=A0A7W5H005_9PORP|nr:hypothetical protein [Microbacter margulisiae]
MPDYRLTDYYQWKHIVINTIEADSVYKWNRLVND